MSVDSIPYVDWENHLSPYRKPEHLEFRKLCDAFVDKEVLPYIDKWENNGNIPKSLHSKCYEAGVYSPKWSKKYGGTPFKNFKFDSFMAIARIESFTRAGSGGLLTSLFISEIALPPVMYFGNEMQKQMFVPVIKGKEIAALAISEPDVGSDVANLKCNAKKDSSSKYYIVNGMKKWISSGIKCKYFVTAVCMLLQSQCLSKRAFSKIIRFYMFLYALSTK